MKHDALKDHLFLNSVNRISEAAATVLVALAPLKLCISMLFADTDLSLNHFHHSYKFQVHFNAFYFLIFVFYLGILGVEPRASYQTNSLPLFQPPNFFSCLFCRTPVVRAVQIAQLHSKHEGPEFDFQNYQTERGMAVHE